MFVIDVMSRVPVYEQLINQVEEQILTGLLNSGDKMPSVRSLSVSLSINPNTIQKAYTELDRRKLIVTVPGKGSFVSSEALNILGASSREKMPEFKQAIKELDEIKQQKLWQQGRSKEYYTLITDTLRKYIEERFGINAMEMTSGEILELIRKNSEAQSVYDNLRQILQLADFVKFAKMNPLPDENDLSMMNAYLFVNQTKVEEMQEPESTNDTTNLKD